MGWRAGFPDSNAVVFENERSELVIYLDDGTPRLSQAVSFFADAAGSGKPTRPTFIVDALTGEIVFEYEGGSAFVVGALFCAQDTLVGDAFQQAKLPFRRATTLFSGGLRRL